MIQFCVQLFIYIKHVLHSIRTYLLWIYPNVGTNYSYTLIWPIIKKYLAHPVVYKVSFRKSFSINSNSGQFQSLSHSRDHLSTLNQSESHSFFEQFFLGYKVQYVLQILSRNSCTLLLKVFHTKNNQPFIWYSMPKYF